MKRTIKKWGHSLAIRLPKAMTEHLQIEEGGEVYLTAEADFLIIRPAPKKANLQDMLGGITDENLHGEIPSGGPIGREIW